MLSLQGGKPWQEHSHSAAYCKGRSHAAHKGPQDPLSSVKSYRFQVVKAQEKQVYQAHQEVYFPANRCRRYLHSILPDDAPASLEPMHLQHTWTYGLRCR